MLATASAVFGVFGLASIVGGIVGYSKAKSRASLIAGGISGAALVAAASCAAVGAHSWAWGIGGGTSLLLAGRFVPAYLKTKKFMPAGMMSGFSALGLIVTIAGLAGV